MRFKRAIGLLALTALLLSGLPAPAAAQTEWPNCENFRDQDDAQAAYDADRQDPFELEFTEPVNDVPCEDEPAFGTEPLVSCDALTDDPDAQHALQGLYDHTRDEGDPYSLDQGGDPAIACDGGGGADEQDPLDGPPRDRRGNGQENLDGPPPDRSRRDREARDEAPVVSGDGTVVVVSATPLGDFASLEERLDARFAALEADFAAFEERAQNGFGRFDESGDGASSGEQGASVIVSSSSRQPAAVTQSEDTTDAGSQALLAQRARDGETIGAHPADRLKARNETKRDNERKAKQRNRHNGKYRTRR
jgi:hypothetical protein